MRYIILLIIIIYIINDNNIIKRGYNRYGARSIILWPEGAMANIIII